MLLFPFFLGITPVFIPGDIGVDPLGLSKCNVFDPFRTTHSPENHNKLMYSEAEIKHGRLAMLASIIYPSQKLLIPVLTHFFESDRESFLHGIYITFGFCSGFEMYKLTSTASKIPADYGWRFTHTSDASYEFKTLQDGEVWNGRLAMLATLMYFVK